MRKAMAVRRAVSFMTGMAFCSCVDADAFSPELLLRHQPINLIRHAVHPCGQVPDVRK